MQAVERHSPVRTSRRHSSWGLPSPRATLHLSGCPASRWRLHAFMISLAVASGQKHLAGCKMPWSRSEPNDLRFFVGDLPGVAWLVCNWTRSLANLCSPCFFFSSTRIPTCAIQNYQPLISKHSILCRYVFPELSRMNWPADAGKSYHFLVGPWILEKYGTNPWSCDWINPNQLQPRRTFSVVTLQLNKYGNGSRLYIYH